VTSNYSKKAELQSPDHNANKILRTGQSKRDPKKTRRGKSGNFPVTGKVTGERTSGEDLTISARSYRPPTPQTQKQVETSPRKEELKKETPTYR